MELSDYVELIKDQVTGFGVLESELDDKAYENIVYKSLRELNRYYNMSQFKSLDCGGTCIDLKDYPEIESVINVYRQDAVGVSGDSQSETDPWSISLAQMYNLGSAYYSSNMAYKLLNYSTMQRVQNTFSTDLNFTEDKINKKLYINFSQGTPDKITIEFIPNLKEPSQVVGKFWEDMLLNLSVAHAKVALGRIRTRYTQSNAIWANDGSSILEEGNTELTNLRDALKANYDLLFPVD